VASFESSNSRFSQCPARLSEDYKKSESDPRPEALLIFH
jgi:hypothetical protein